MLDSIKKAFRNFLKAFLILGDCCFIEPTIKNSLYSFSIEKW